MPNPQALQHLSQAAAVAEQAGDLPAAAAAYRELVAALLPEHAPGGASGSASGSAPDGSPNRAPHGAPAAPPAGVPGRGRGVARSRTGDGALLARLGTLEYLLGNLPEAIDCLSRAARIDRRDVNCLVNLGLAQHAAGRHADAASSLRKAITLKPDLPAAHNNLGLVLSALGDVRGALACARRAVALAPDDAQARYNLGNALYGAGEFTQAQAAYRLALAAAGPQPALLFNLGNAERALEHVDEAIDCYRQAVALDPDYAAAWINLGNLLMRRRDHDDAEAAFERALGGNSTPAGAPSALAVEARYNLANLQRMTGRLDAALASYQAVLAVEPMHEAAYSNLLLTMNYSDAVSREAAFDAHVEYGRRFAPSAPLPPLPPLPSLPSLPSLPPRPSRPSLPHLPHLPPSPAVADAGRGSAPGADGDPADGSLPASARAAASPLRIGFVSPDFREHAVARFAEPLIDHLPAHGFAVFCYSNHERADAVTDRLRAKVAGWHDIRLLDDDAVAARIARDRIDLLVDLAGHTAGHRLRVFARRPAPVQLTMIGHVNTTGVAAIDYRVTDLRTEPADGEHERWYTEKLLRLPETCWCMRAAEGSGPVPRQRTAGDDAFTFASFNNFAKLSERALDLWAELLCELPATRLVVVTVPEGATQLRLRERFARSGVDPARLELHGLLPADRYRALHGRVDLALDPFPCNGATTTIDTLWLGVPVLALAGDSFRSRNGCAILASAGLAPLIAHTPAQYLQIARRLATDPDELAALRALTGEHLRKTPLMDEVAFAAALARLLRNVAPGRA